MLLAVCCVRKEDGAESCAGRICRGGTTATVCGGSPPDIEAVLFPTISLCSLSRQYIHFHRSHVEPDEPTPPEALAINANQNGPSRMQVSRTHRLVDLSSIPECVVRDGSMAAIRRPDSSKLRSGRRRKTLH